MYNQQRFIPLEESSENLVSSSVEDKSGIDRGKDAKILLGNRKLCLVLDLDHTLLNSVPFSAITNEEAYLLEQDTLPDALKSSLFRSEDLQLMTKLRPYVQTFLKEASKLFELYIYTKGTRQYASEMVKLLDPDGICFKSGRIAAQGDGTQRQQKNLSFVVWHESEALIVDDDEWVWEKHGESLILIEKYHFFASSCKAFGCKFKAHSELRDDESETDGALATILRVLQQIHSLFINSDPTGYQADRDVRQVLKTIRKEVLNGCKLVYSRIVPAHSSEEYRLSFWDKAEKLGATCTMNLDPSATHVISMDSDTVAARWAVRENMFVVSPKWIEASYCSWKREPEADYFPINS